MGVVVEHIANGRFFKATSIDDALAQFAKWANFRNMTTSDIYAIAISDVVDRQRREMKEDYAIDYGLNL